MKKRGSSSGTARGLPLTYRLILVSMLPIVLLSIIVTVVSSHILRQRFLDLVLERNTALAHGLALSVSENLNAYLCPLQTGAEAVARHMRDPAQQERILRDAAPLLHPFGGDIVLLDATGIAIATTSGHEERKGLDCSFRDYFQEVRAGRRPAFSVVLKEKPSGRDAVIIATPVLDNGEFGGALIGFLFLDDERWTGSLGLLSTPAAGRVYLIDSDNNVIFHPQKERVGTNIEADEPLSRLVLAAKPDSVLREAQNSGIPVVTSYAPLPTIGWGLLVEEPWSSISAPVSGYHWVVGALLSLGILLSVLLLFLGVNRVMRHLNALVPQVREMSGDVRFQSLEVQGPPEVRVLIDTFNRMATQLAGQQAALRRFAGQVLRGQEDERKRLSRELHDETAQELVGLVQRIELCRNVLIQDPAGAEKRLDELQGLTEETLAGVRRMSNDLRPHILEDLGLVASLETLTEELSEQIPSARVLYDVVGSERRLPSEAELTAFRIVQEALNNVRRHAPNATLVSVELRFEKERVTVTVLDDGPGFLVPETQSLMREGHLGLAGMSERARLIGGEVDLTSTPGEGTVVTLRIPSMKPSARRVRV